MASSEPESLNEPVLLELFTSQGCSSCPPADRLAARLADDPGLVVISRPVTYWDRLGWKDTLARESNTALQRAYAQRQLEGRNGVYTPQIVADGTLGAIGSRENTVRNQASLASKSSSAAIRAKVSNNGALGIGIGGTTREPAELVLISVASRETVAIGRGENRGRSIGYTNVVIDERVIATWNGGKASHVIAPGDLSVKGADKHAIVVRVPNGGKVLAARWLP